MNSGYSLALGPRDAERPGGAPQPLDVARVRGRERAQQAHLALAHQVRRAHPGEQRDLGVPLLDRVHRPELQQPPVVDQVQLLLRQREVDAAPGLLAVQPQLPDLLEQAEHLLGRPGVDRLLDLLVGELGARPHQRALELRVGAFAGLVQRQRPEQGGPDLVGQQRPGVL
jgi:hypothetical protein